MQASLTRDAVARSSCVPSTSRRVLGCSTVRLSNRLPTKPLTQMRSAEATAVADTAADAGHPIKLTSKALDHLKKMRAEVGGSELLLRVGVKQGGCSGMSYTMDFEKAENIKEDDFVMDYNDGEFRIACDSKSLLYLFNMSMDYSDALIGGGFQFINPNAVDSCGCGKSFGV